MNPSPAAPALTSLIVAVPPLPEILIIGPKTRSELFLLLLCTSTAIVLVPCMSNELISASIIFSSIFASREDGTEVAFV